ncbi:NAD(P)-binding domain-containing protein [Candidatus Reidiella endopervernicosa]|uniref:NAD(P)-binding domain-containing protein n=1 Tax=Candidatus Reidiella endopervernicosa TaxID=2738883 RepID=A0A6N0I0Y9_9GAMM|nr:NAD(P)-binding domain-containing protein [Candidatus Reidiella endopervernicosa]
MILDIEMGQILYFSPMLVILLSYIVLAFMKERHALAAKRETISSGLTEPASLHPLIDTTKCIGCGSCVTACPENLVLGLIKKRAELISPSHCIGHGACARACPMKAITLVFGTEKRGVDIPQIDESFETNVPGIYIAGELGGMGLIRNASEQGRQAMESIYKVSPQKKEGDWIDALVVGAGPAGIAANLVAKERKMSIITLEQESLGGTVAHYPRGKVVMTAPVKLPLVGKTRFKETTKERLLEFWSGVVEKHELQINFEERLEAVASVEGGFEVTSNKRSYRR